MNKKLISIAVAAAFAMPMVASADAETKFYASMHVAGEMFDPGAADAIYRLDGGARKGSRLGAQGSIDTGMMEMKAIAQIEVGLDQGSASASKSASVCSKAACTAASEKTSVLSGAAPTFYERDSWVGLSSKALGSVRAGTIGTSYKQSGGMIDPLFQTALEGRGFMDTMSAELHAGTGEGRGRSTHTVRYDSPEFGGAKAIVDVNLNPDAEDNMGFGVHWKGGPAFAFFDMQMAGEGNRVTNNAGGKDTGNAMKFGGKYSMGAIDISAQYEIDGGSISRNSDKGSKNLLFVAGAYKMGATILVATAGMAAETKEDAKDGHTAFGLAAKQMLDKKTYAYVGYGMTMPSDKGYNGDEGMSALAVGMDMYF